MTFIKDKNGQWAHPGKNTLIPDADGRITMKGVNYPVLGIDDEGNQQVMMPGGEYKFPGNDVYEIPLPKYQMLGGVDKVRKIRDAKNVITPIINWGQNTFPSIFGTPPPSIINKPNITFTRSPDIRPKTFEEWDWHVNKYNIQNKGGLQIKSLMGDNSILRNTDKRGNVNINTLIQFSNNVDNLADKAVLNKSIDDIIATVPSNVENVNKYKIPYRIFEEQVQNNLVKFTPKLTDKYADVGLRDLGYENDIIHINNAGDSYPSGSSSLPANIKNHTILWQNKNLPGPQAGGHFERSIHGPTYGHSRYFIDPEYPNIFNVLEVQSDAFQKRIKVQISKLKDDIAEAEKELALQEEGAYDFKTLDADGKYSNYAYKPDGAFTESAQQNEFQRKLAEDKKQYQRTLNISNTKLEDLEQILKSRTPVQSAQNANLEKNYMNRLFSETVNYAAQNNYTTVRFPHQSTVATIEGFGGGQLTLEDRLENAWTEINIAEFDKNLKNLSEAQTWGHTKIAKKYGPFVYVPNSSNNVYGNFDNGGGNLDQVIGTNPNFNISTNSVVKVNNTGETIARDESGPLIAKHLKPNVKKYFNDEEYRTELQKLGWTDDEMLDLKNNVGHWKNNFIANKKDGSGQDILVREISFSTDKNKWDHKQNNIDIPIETQKNLQPGYYHIQDDGTWKFISGTSEGIKTNPANNENNKKIFFDYAKEIRNINHKEKQVDLGEFDIDNYSDNLKTILVKYKDKNFDNMMKSTFGKDKVDYELILDNQGNKWWQFVLPPDYQRGSGPIKAFQLGGGIKTYQDGGAVDYSDTEEVTINNKTYYTYKVKSGDTKSAISEKYNLWNEQGILNSVNSNFSDVENQPNYAKNINRMWAGDKILVGGPEFDPHVQYSTDRKKYKNSFKNISDDELHSTISAIGHLETGNLVKYKKPEGRVYITGKDLDEFGNTIPGGQYDLDNHPFLGEYESGMDDAYGFVSSANALGRFGIKMGHVNKYGKDILGYKEGDDWKANYLNNKDDQRKLMKYLITDVYPQEILQLRHSNPAATAQYSDFELIAALHRAGQGELKDQLSKGQFSTSPVKGDISVGGYTEKANRYLNPELNISKSPFFMKNHNLIEPFKDIPTYKFGGSTSVKDEIIGDMLQNEAFLPKFKMGSEKTIEGMLGKYNIKKGYDNNIQLPYIEYKTPIQEIENNKIYYDNNSIIDIDKQKLEQKRFLLRMKDIVTRYNKGESITQAEENEMARLGLLDNKPKAEVKQQDRVAPMKYGGASMPLDNINVSKDLFNKTDGNNYGLSLASQILFYEARIDGILDKDKKFNKLKSIYNKLNTLYYNEAKASKMTVLDYMKSLNN